MKLRTQLVIVFLLLAILPLAGIVIYSYWSSQKAFRKAVEKETLALAEQMDERVAVIRKDLDRRIERIGGLPIDTLIAASDAAGENAPTDAAAAVLAAELGDSAQFLDRLEWLPEMPTGALRADGVTTVAPVAPVLPAVPPPPTPEVEEIPEPPAPPSPHTIVIEIPRVAVGADGIPVISGSEKRTITTSDEFGVSVDVQAAIADAKRVAETAKLEAQFKQLELNKERLESEALRRELRTVVVQDGSQIGTLKAQVREDAIVRKVLHGAAPETEDVAFAINEDGTILTASEDDRARLSGLDVEPIAAGSAPTNQNWVVATSKDQQTGLTFGVARPVRESLQQMRASAMNSFAWGLGLIALALFGIVPIANHLTRDIERVMQGADRIGQGDLDSPVEVSTSNEIGRLGAAFNRMATDLKQHQARLLDEERRRREREVEQRVLEAEYARKSRELEEARTFQLSLLPAEPPTHHDLDIAVLVRTATEVGGDYYDYRTNDDGSLTLAIGDATGHGARAGTMVTVVKSLFAGKVDGTPLEEFLDEGNRTIRKMGIERMAMALTVARYESRRLEIASAGMPPALIHRASSGAVDELQCEAPPLGSLSHAYQCLATDLAAGDVILLMTDGFPELENEDGEPLGYDATENLFADVASRSPHDILKAFADEADRWTGGQPPSDDMTFVAIRVKA